MFFRIYSSLADRTSIKNVFDESGIKFSFSLDFKAFANNESKWIQTTKEKLENVLKESSPEFGNPTPKTSRDKTQMASSTTSVSRSDGLYDQTIFIDSPMKYHFCFLCKIVMRDPHQIDCCEAMICLACKEDSDANYECPRCKNKNHTVLRDKRTQNEIMKLKVRCNKSSDCPWTGSLGNLENHECITSKTYQNGAGESTSSRASLMELHHLDDVSEKTSQVELLKEIQVSVNEVTMQVVLEWSKPQKSSCVVTKYEVHYCDSENLSDWFTCEHKFKTECKATIAGLCENLKLMDAKRYYFKISAHFSDGRIMKKSSPPIHLLSLINDPPGTPKVLKRTNESIQLTWDKPQYGYMKVKNYHVLYKLASQPEKDENWHQKQIESTNITIDELMSFQVYHVKIVANYGNEAIAKESKPTEVTTESSFPLPPGKPGIREFKRGKVVITWTEPDKAYKPVEHYVLQYYPAINELSPNTSKVEICNCPTNEIEISLENFNHESHKKYLFKVQAVYKSESSEFATDEVEFIVENMTPSRPGPPRVEITGPTSVNVSWVEPDKNPGTVMKEVVSYCTSDDIDLLVDSAEIFFTNESVEIKDLKPRQYYFKMKAYYQTNKFVEGRTSRVFHLGVQNDPPSKPSADEISHDMVKLSWIMSSRAFVQRYQVAYKPYKAENWDGKEVDKNQSSCTINDLQSLCRYSFKVIAIFSGGIRQESVTNDNIKTLTVFPNSPIIRTPCIATETTATIQWSPPIGSKVPKIHSIIYEVAYALKDRAASASDKWMFLPKCIRDSTKIAVTDLKPKQCYVFKVRAKYGNDESNFSDVYVIQTLPIRISQPCQFEICDDQNNYLLKWKEPEKNSQYVHQYKIQHNEKEIETCSGDTFCVQISKNTDQLESNTEYKLHVVGVNTDGIEGLPSESCILKTKPPMPGKLSELCLVKPEAEKVTVAWKKPQLHSDSVDAYIITCYKVGMQSNEMTFEKECKVKATLREITIDELSPQTQYKFGIKAASSNRFTEEIYSENIQTTSVAICPTNVKTVNVTTTSVKLQWNMPEHHKNVHYTVEHCKHDIDVADEWHSVQNADQLANCVVKHLSQNTKYKFRVCSYNEGSTSSWTEPIIVSTQKTISKAPGTPCETSRKSRSILLQWNKPDRSEYVEKYEVICFSENNPMWQKGDPHFTKFNENALLFSDLKPDKGYYFKVRAHCQNGNTSDFSNKSEVFYTIKPLPHVSDIVCSSNNAITDSTVSISWKYHYEEGLTISKFKISYSTLSKNAWQDAKSEGGQNNFTIHNLEPNTEYIFKVQAKSKQYNEYGPESKVSKPVKTRHAPPGKPKIIEPQTPEYLTLTWKPPCKNAEYVEGYAIRYCSNNYDINRAENWYFYQSKKFAGNELEGNIEKLKFGVSYSFKVVAFYKKEVEGYSESEMSEWVSRKFPIPSAPRLPRILESKPTAISLEWDKPDLFSEFVKHYKVYVVPENNSKAGPIPVEGGEVYNTGITVTGLSPNTGYYFQIEAVNHDNEASRMTSRLMKTKGLVIPPGQPGKPFTIRVTHNMVKIRWEKPKTNPELTNYYIVKYKNDQDDKWISSKSQVNDAANSGFEVTGLNHSTKYYFTVTAYVNETICSETSQVSEPVITRSTLPSAPGKPKGTANFTSITLQWDKPQTNYENISHYEIAYYPSDDKSKSKKKKTSGKIGTIVIDGLQPNKGYLVGVTAVTKANEKGEKSLISDLISSDQSLASKFIPHCDRVSGRDEWEIPVYLLPKGDNMVKDEKLQLIKKYDIKLEQKPQKHFPVSMAKFTSRSQLPTQKKVIMLVGATGSGKSMLINGMINYMMGVEFNDHFRLKLVELHEHCVDETESLTQFVSAFTVHQEPGFRLPYTLTIVDTPGFGADKRGMVRDTEITHLIKSFFEMKNGIDHLDGIGFVCQSGCVRLTSTQRYIFESIFSMFGKDIRNNIFILCTFCDGETPKVIKALEEANIPSTKCFKFNNSSLYSSSKNPMTEQFWDIGAESFRKFFQKFESVAPVSLKLTKYVLQLRETLEILAEGLHRRIQKGVNLIESMKMEYSILEENKASLEANKKFKYQIEEAVIVEQKIERGKYTTNCMKCNMTCHYPCDYSNDEKKKKCSAMKNNNGKENASCGVCPGRCGWSSHRNAPFIITIEKKVVEKEYVEVHRKYREAMEKKKSVEAVIEKLKCDIDEEFEEVFELVKEANECTMRLDEIAFCPSHFGDLEQYIQLLIDGQFKERKPGYWERIQQYRTLQERAKLLDKREHFIQQATKQGKHWWEKIELQSD